MTSPDRGPAYEPFLAAADALARARPEIDRDVARELLGEAAVMLHNGLALDGLDAHDLRAVIDALCIDLAGTPDPGAAVRARADAALGSPDFHDPDAVFAALINTAAILRL